MTARGPPITLLPSFSSPVPSTWKEMSGVFTLLWITNTSHQSVTVAMAPNALLDDGVFTVTLIRDSSAMGMVSTLLALDDKGSHLQVPGVEQFTCSAWRLEPDPRGGAPLANDGAEVEEVVVGGAGAGGGGGGGAHVQVKRRPPASALHVESPGHVCLDGEVVPYGPVQAEIHPKMLKVFGPKGVPARGGKGGLSVV
jgi:diacylglycerol kinase family enzyme